MALDDFNRANGNLSTNWTALFGKNMPRIVSNQATNQTAADSGARWTGTGTPFSNDQYSRFAYESGTDLSPIVRAASGAEQWYEFNQDAGTYGIFKDNGGAYTQIGSTSAGTPSAGDIMEIQVSGTTLKAYVNPGTQPGSGTPLISGTDSSFSSGSIAWIAYGDSSGTIDNFDGGSLSGTAFTQTVAGGVAPSGALLKRPGIPLAGGSTPSGALVKRDLKPLTGGATPAGTLAKQTRMALSGAVASAGSLVRLTAKVLAGAIGSAGSLAKRTARALAGAISSSGVLAGVKTALVALAGAITPTGALSKQTGKALTGALSSAGALVKLTARALSGALSFAGSLLSQIRSSGPAAEADYIVVSSAEVATVEAIGSYQTVAAVAEASTIEGAGEPRTVVSAAETETMEADL